MIRFPLRDPYVTFDYQAFCQAMLGQTDADVWQARANGLVAMSVATTCSTARARFIVDATGRRALHASGAEPAWDPLQVGYGIETELPLRLALSPGLHFYFEKRIVRSGYGWVFPCGATTRFGVVAFAQEPRLRLRLAQFVERFGLRPGATHGGVQVIERRDPVALHHGRRCWPVPACYRRRIRTAIFHGIHCGREIAAALRSASSAEVLMTLGLNRYFRGTDRQRAF